VSAMMPGLILHSQDWAKSHSEPPHAKSLLVTQHYKKTYCSHVQMWKLRQEGLRCCLPQAYKTGKWQRVGGSPVTPWLFLWECELQKMYYGLPCHFGRVTFKRQPGTSKRTASVLHQPAACEPGWVTARHWPGQRAAVRIRR
jgi:hypothetical protein